MTVRDLSLVAVAGVLCAAAWFALPIAGEPSGRGGGNAREARTLQQRPFGSAVPCAAPLQWRVGRVDPGFQLGPTEAEAAVRAAEDLWEAALGRELFSHDSVAGFPVHFDYDDRQAMLRIRTRLEREIGDLDRMLDGRRVEVEALRVDLLEARGEHEERRREYELRVREHNRRVRGWNERGGAPAEVRHTLRMADSLLAVERRSLDEQEAALRVLQQAVQRGAVELNHDIGVRNRRLRSLAEAVPTTQMEAGRYSESVRTRDGEVDSIQREIRVFRFADGDELVAVLAHEMGHALGLGHSPASGSIMSAVSIAGAGPEGAPRIDTDDAARLLELCPGLAEAGQGRR